VIDAAWQLGKADREAMDAKLIAEAYRGNGAAKSQPSVAEAKDSEEALLDSWLGTCRFAVPRNLVVTRISHHFHE
jgi:hypothetical protein